MRNHQEQQLHQQPIITLMDYSHQKSNLETTHNHHVPPPPPPQSLRIFKRYNPYDQQDIHVSNKTNIEDDDDDERFIFKKLNNNANYQQVINKPNSLSCSSSLTAGEGDTTAPPPATPPQDFKKTHHHHNINIHAPPSEDEGFAIVKNDYEVIKKPAAANCCSSLAAGEEAMTTPQEVDLQAEEMSGREKLKRHRVEMAGRVWIPDIWGHEDVLKDWIDCTVFDSSLGNNNIMSARAALIQEGRSSLRNIHNQC